MNVAAALQIEKPYLLYLGDVANDLYAKTAFGLRDWLPGTCVGQFRRPGCVVDAQLPDMTPAEAVLAGAKTLVIGVASVGGGLPEAWIDDLAVAMRAGLHVASGMHQRLVDAPVLRELSKALGLHLHDVRHNGRTYPVATGKKRSGHRLLTVGTDCALGKKYTALALAREMQAQGLDADFRATGQTGILISGSGIPLDAVVVDFAAGAAECLSPANAPHHWDVIEGQGSLFHPGYAGVTLALVHGSQPDALVLCHDPTRHEIGGYPGFRIPSLEAAMASYLAAAQLTNPQASFLGVALNTSKLSAAASLEVLAQTEQQLGLPCVDPIRTGVARLVTALKVAYGH